MTCFPVGGSAGKTGFVEWTVEQLEAMETPDLGRLARTVVATLAARSGSDVEFREMLATMQAVSEGLAVSARGLADSHSWANVGTVLGTSRQAAWERWH
jgi:hypothetical protein